MVQLHHVGVQFRGREAQVFDPPILDHLVRLSQAGKHLFFCHAGAHGTGEHRGLGDRIGAAHEGKEPGGREDGEERLHGDSR